MAGEYDQILTSLLGEALGRDEEFVTQLLIEQIDRKIGGGEVHARVQKKLDDYLAGVHSVEVLPDFLQKPEAMELLKSSTIDWNEVFKDALHYAVQVVVSADGVRVGDLIASLVAKLDALHTQPHPPVVPVEPPPVPDESIEIHRVTFDWAARTTRAQGTDNFPMTWAKDGHQYTMGGDGQGFNNKWGKQSLLLSRIGGDYGQETYQDLWHGNGKSYGILALDDHVYAWRGPGSTEDSLRETWLYRFTVDGELVERKRLFSFADKLAMPCFLQLGQNYQYRFDEYVYAYAPYPSKLKWEIWEGDDPALNIGTLWCFRAPRDKLMHREAYEFWAGNNVWVKDVHAKKPVWAEPTKIMLPAVAYNPGLNRYIFMTEHSHQQRGNLQIWDSATPFGPWRRVALMTKWGHDHGIEASTFYWNFAPKWWSSDGRKGVLVYTGIRSNDSYNTLPVKLN